MAATRIEPIAPGDAQKPLRADDWLAEAQRVRWETATTMLAAGQRPADVARELAVNPSTVNHWLREPAFVSMLHEKQADARAHASRALASYVVEALATLATLMRGESPGQPDAEVPPAVQARCAAELLDRAGIRGADSSGASADAIEAELLTMPAASLQSELAAAVALLEAQARRVETTTETTVTVVAAPDAAR